MRKCILLTVALLTGGCAAQSVEIQDIKAGLILCVSHGGLETLYSSRVAVCEDGTRFTNARWRVSREQLEEGRT